MRIGVGPRTGEIFVLLAHSGEAVLEVCRAVDARFREWPNGPTQEDVKDREHVADSVISELLSMTNAVFVTPYDRDDLVTLAFAVDDVADAAESAAELLGMYGVQNVTRQSFELCGLLVEAAEQLAHLLAELKGLRGSSPRIVAIKEIEDRADYRRRAYSAAARACSRTTASTR